MAMSTATTSLLTSATQGGTYASLVDIISYPDMGSTPSKLDTTDLSASVFKTSILGLQDVPDLTFECNYDEATYNTINTITGTQWFHLAFGEVTLGAGEFGTFEWSGQVQIYAMGGGVDEVRKMTVTLSASTPLTFIPVA
jgi:hypothetical protein